MAIKAKKKKCRDCGVRSYIFSRGRCKFCYNMWYVSNKKNGNGTNGKRNYYKKVKRKKRSEREILVSKIDRVYSRLVRIREANKYGQVRCYTCGKKISWKWIQAGHYRSRREYALRWEDVNVHPQCKHCNMTLHGNLDVYCQRLQMDYGVDICSELEQQGKSPALYSLPELREMYGRYKYDLDKLRKEKGI